MNPFSRSFAARGLLFFLLLPVAADAQAQALLDQVTLVPDATVAANPVNAPQAFTIQTAGSYTVTLTDLATPTPLSSMSVAITTATGPAQSFPLPIQSGATSPYSVSTVATFAAGSYFAQVLASANQPGGTFSVVVTPVAPAGSPAVLSYHDVIAAPPTPTVGSVVQAQFVISSSGSYTLTAPDFQFPAALVAGSQTIFVLNDCSTSPSPSCQSVPVLSNLPMVAPSTATLSAGTYDLYAYAQADPTAQAGLYGISITGAGTPATAYAATVPVGQLPAGYAFDPPSAGMVSLTLTDLGTGVQPPPLAPPLVSLKAIVVQGANVLLTPATVAGGPSPYQFSAAAVASAGPAELFVAATPNTAAGLGGWAAYLVESGTSLADIAQPVVASGHYGYDFTTPAPLTAGNYTANVVDFQKPALTEQNVVVVQRAQALATAPAANPLSVDLPFTALAGIANVLVFPVPAVSPGTGLFGVSVQQSGTGINELQTTQGVGTLFSSVPLVVPAAGTYGVTITDLGFLAAFGSLALVPTFGNTAQGSVTTGGAGRGATFTIDAPGAGTYTLNVLAQVGSGVHYGLYGLTAGLVPAATLTPAAMSVGSGQDVLLSWTSTNATGCTASGGWSGAEPITGSMVNAGTITQDTVFTLTCTGPGGPMLMPASVTVDYTSSSSSSSSGGGSGSGSSKGGGAFSPWTLLALGVLAALNLRRRRAMLPG